MALTASRNIVLRQVNELCSCIGERVSVAPANSLHNGQGSLLFSRPILKYDAMRPHHHREHAISLKVGSRSATDTGQATQIWKILKRSVVRHTGFK